VAVHLRLFATNKPLSASQWFSVHELHEPQGIEHCDVSFLILLEIIYKNICMHIKKIFAGKVDNTVSAI